MTLLEAAINAKRRANEYHFEAKSMTGKWKKTWNEWGDDSLNHALFYLRQHRYQTPNSVAVYIKRIEKEGSQ